MGAVYTWSHAIDYEDNGAGSGAEGTKFNYPVDVPRISGYGGA